MAKDVRIVPSTGIIEFKNEGISVGSITESGGNIYISTSGYVSFGDGTPANLEIGATNQSVDFTFLGGGSITAGGNTINIGVSGDTVNLAVPGVTYQYPTNLNAASLQGYVASDFAIANHFHTIANVTGLQAALDSKQAAGSYLTTTGKAADSNLLDGIDSSSFLRSDTSDIFTGSLTINGDIRGGGQQLVLNAGESYSYASGQTDEYVYVNAENGFMVSTSPDNWGSGWAGRQTTIITGASISVNGSTVWHTGNFNPGSYLGINAKAADSELLDGINSTSFLRSDAADTFTGILTGTATGENLKIGGIRGTTKGSQTGEYIHLYERVHIGGPAGWGASTHGAPTYGLSTWGSVDFGMNGTGVIQLDGTTIVTAARALTNVTNTNWDAAYSWGNHAGLYLGINAKAADSNLLDGLDSTAFMRATNANGYYGLTTPGGNTTDWIRTTAYGLIPYQSGGYSSIGTSSWPFSTIYVTTLYENGTALSSKYLGISAKASDSFNLNGSDWNTTNKIVRWSAGSGYHGNPRSMAIGYSGGNYGQFGYGIDFTATSGVHTYAIADVVTRVDLYGGLIVYGAPSGTVGTNISWTETFRARYTDSAPTFKGNVIWHAGNDGAGSGLNADLLDGIDSSSFLRSDADNTFGDATKTLTIAGVVRSNNNGNVYGPNFNVSTTNKNSAEYAYRVDRSGTVVGGITIGGQGVFADGLTVGTASFTAATINNWNTAYGWGNHAGLYAASAHQHDGGDIVSGTIAAERIADLSGTYALASHSHSYLPLSGGTLTGDVTTSGNIKGANLQLSGATPTLYFNGTNDGGDYASSDMAIKATPEGLDFYEPEDGNKIHFQILDDLGVNSPFGYQWNGQSLDARYAAASHSHSNYAPLASPALTGTPTAPTASAATNSTQIATTAFVKTAISDLVSSAPAALDTLNELAAALGNDANFSTTITTALSGKLGNSGQQQLGKTAHAPGTSSYHLELYSPDTGDSNNEISMRFHQGNRYWGQLRYRNGAFRITGGADDIVGTMYANIIGNVTGTITGNASTATTLQTTRTLTIGNTGKSFNGSADASWTLAEIGALGATATAADSNKLGGLAASSYLTSVPAATSTARGGVELFSDTVQTVAANAVTATASRTYGVQLNSAGQAVVNVPWVDTNTNTTYSAGTALTLSGTTFSVTDNAIGATQLNVSGNGTTAQYLRSDGDGSFTWATPPDTNTTYSAGTGLTLSGTTFSVTANTYAAASHTHSAGDITSGTLDAARLPRPVSGDWWNSGAIVVGNDGVMEVGKYMDWHETDAGTSDYDYRMYVTSGRMYMSGDLELDGGDLYLNDGNTRLHEGTGNSLKITTDSGWVELAPMNTSHCHIQTDRSNFYFNTELRVDTGIIGSYNEDLQLRRAGSNKIYVSDDTTTSYNHFVPDTDRIRTLGTDALRWQIIFCETLDSAGLHEANLASKKTGFYATGTVLVWKDGEAVPCTDFADHMKIGIAVYGNPSPLVQGAEPVLCTGQVREGDYLVTSQTEGHAVAMSRKEVKEQDIMDCVIGKALESGNGESHLIKTWVNI